MTRRYNPNWNKFDPYILSDNPPEFERIVEELGLRPDQYLGSNELRQWAKSNLRDRYVPEYLLRAWNLDLILEPFFE